MIGIGIGIPHSRNIRRLKYLLDEDFAQGATAAYALRLLREKHSGGIIRCRADDAGTSKGEADVLPIRQPDGSKIITLNSPIENFTGTPFSGDGYVLADLVDAGNGNYDGLTSSWYDQSGNGNDASNSTASEQPQIVSSGTLIKENGKPALQFDGNDDFLDVGVSITIDSFFNVLKSNANNGGSGEYNNKKGLLFADKSNSTPFILFGSGTSTLTKETFFITGAGKLGTDSTKVIQSQILLSTLTTDSKIFADGVAVNLIATAAVPNQFNLQIGTRQSGGSPFDGTMQEIIIYNSDKASNRNGIESNINNHYSIF